MRLLKIPLLCLVLILTLSGLTEAQVVCGPDPSPFDIYKVGNGEVGKPGDTTRVSVNLTNLKSLAALKMFIEYDKTVLDPLIFASDFTETITTTYDTIQFTPDTLVDTIVTHDTIFTNYYEIDTEGGRMKQIYLNDGVTLAYSILVTDENVFPSTDPDIGRLNVSILPLDFSGTPRAAVDSGNGAIFYIPFEVNSGAQHNSIASFDLYEEPIFDNSFPPNLISCQYSNYSDTTGELGGDVRPTVQIGSMIVDTTNYVCPTIISFTANPTSISQGSSSTLSWDVVDADSISINNGVGVFTSLSSFTTVSPGSNRTYTLTAYSSNCPTSPTASASITVTAPGENFPPVIQSVAGSPFTINQGETISFSVTATDQDAGDIITLSASSLPNNATFSQVVGSGSVTGNFSFTPDITQSGTYNVTFLASDNIDSRSYTVSITVNELEFDRLFTTSAPGQLPVGGLKGKQNIYFPINMVTVNEVYGVQFDFFYNPVFFTVDSFIVTGRTADYVVYDNIGQTPGEIKVVTFGLNNEPIVTIPDTTAILYAVMSIDSNAAPGDYPVWFENGWESINPDPNVPSLELVVDSGVIQVDTPGDVNLDKRIDVADLVSVVASIINNFTLNGRQFDVADIIVNDTVNVFDLVGIVNLIYGLPINPAPPVFEDERATIELAYGDVQAGGNEMIVVNTETPADIAAVELNIQYDPYAVVLGTPELAADAQGMTIRSRDDMTGNMKILIHFNNPFGGELIETGFAEMVEIPLIAKDEIISGDKNRLKITEAYFSTRTAARIEVDGVDAPSQLPTSFFLSQNYPNPFNPTTKIDFNIESTQHVRLVVYNILGQYVKSLVDSEMPAGAHTIEWDATNSQGSRVASGIYLYRLTVEQNTQSKKMLFLK